MENKKKWSIRVAEFTDVPKVAALYNNDPHEEKVDLGDFSRTWSRLYIDTPTKKTYVKVGVDSENQPVAHYAIMPLEFQNAGKKIVGGSPSQLIVDQAFRKELLFITLELNLLREYVKSGIDFLYGLVSKPHILEAHLKLGFKMVGEIPVFAHPISIQSIARKMVKQPFLNLLLRPFTWLADQVYAFANLILLHGPITVEEVNSFSESDSAAIAGLNAQYSNTSVKDSATLNWRYVRSEVRDYRFFVAKDQGKVCGYAVVRLMNMRQFKVVGIADLMAQKESTAVVRALVKKLRALGKSENADLITCLLNAKDKTLILLKRYFFLKGPESFYLILHADPKGGFLPALKGKDAAGYEQLLQDWHITWYDHDYV